MTNSKTFKLRVLWFQLHAARNAPSASLLGEQSFRNNIHESREDSLAGIVANEITVECSEFEDIKELYIHGVDELVVD